MLMITVILAIVRTTIQKVGSKETPDYLLQVHVYTVVRTHCPIQIQGTSTYTYVYANVNVNAYSKTNINTKQYL